MPLPNFRAVLRIWIRNSTHFQDSSDRLGSGNQRGAGIHMLGRYSLGLIMTAATPLDFYRGSSDLRL